MNNVEQQFFNDLEKKLWTAADKLRSSLDASVYKHVVLGLIFLKYVSDAFEERQNELRAQFQNPDHDYYMAPEDYADDYEGQIAAELEVRDYYTEKNVFWVPVEARWQTLRDLAQLPPGSELPWQVPKRDSDGRYMRNEAGELVMVPDKMRTVGWLIDNAMEAVERENAKLKNVLNRDFARTQIDSHKLADLIAHFSDTNFSQPSYDGQALNLKSKDTIENKLATVLADDELFEDEELRSASEDEQPDILARYVCKIYIRNEERDACLRHLRHLRRMNVHHASLFPDLLGASEYCNVITTEAEMAAAVQQRGNHHEVSITEGVTATDQVDAEVMPSAATAATLTSIEDALRQPAGAEQMEPGRITLMAEELAASIAKNKVVDWETRDAVQARLRNVVRVVLRKYGYPQTLR